MTTTRKTVRQARRFATQVMEQSFDEGAMTDLIDAMDDLTDAEIVRAVRGAVRARRDQLAYDRRSVEVGR